MTSSRSNQIEYSSKVGLSAPSEHQTADNGVYRRDFSDTSWSIGLNSDSETESEWFTGPAGTNMYGEAFVLNHNHLSTFADKTMELEEEDMNVDTCSLDDSSRHQDCNSISDFSPRSEQSTSTFDDSSPRQIRGLSALDSRWKANSIAEIVTTQSGFPFFSNDSDYNGLLFVNISIMLHSLQQ
ncbi:hypothetical protein KXD40_007596 [Peronospora effusa]|uniref:Uncharacterized protein n=1 Tax=Peronospora effusa TaxID=542832 RepID=A0A3M6VJW4_9STRA|nr:hypothetical protein DD238_002132 [Peronospora effusa]RQM16905.1 hypothetical protein DD237_002753 [Peronospora effusa]UIZ28920.1 hypothetical protein KXD40_007596 [Peronospora effusa]CAI5704164.1 unnamed protein product [Peronospora effusa]